MQITLTMWYNNHMAVYDGNISFFDMTRSEWFNYSTAALTNASGGGDRKSVV